MAILLLATTAANAQPTPEPQPQQPPQPAQSPGQAEPALPDPTNPTPTPAEAAFLEGRQLMEEGKYDEACAKFTASIKDDPEASGTLLNLGLCNEKLGKTATALAWFRKAQFRSAETKMTEYEAAAKEHTSQLAPKVPTLKIEVAPGTKVTINGIEVREVDFGLIEVDAGKHVIEGGGERREVVIVDGQKRTVDLRPPPKVFITVDRGASQRRWALIAGGAGLALVASSTALSLIGRSNYDSTDRPETYQKWQGIVRYGGTSLFLVGAAAITGAVYYYYDAPPPERVQQVAPLVGPNQIGVAVAGSF